MHMVTRPLMPGSTAILLFIKAPVRGRVKTRLAAVLGDDVALELYRNFVLDILDTIGKAGHPCSLCYFPFDAGSTVIRWLGEQHDYLAQEGHDLGERMATAFQTLFSRDISRVCLIGSDLPDLPLDIFKEAFDALQTNDAVIGPATDGGYYLIGFRKETFLPDVFRDIPWGTSAVQEKTSRIFKQAGSRVHLLPHWSDVDTAEDLRYLAERNADTAFAHSRTMRYLDTEKGRLWNQR